MPAHRLPVDVAAVTGKADRSPGRHAGRSKPKGTRALGGPYKKMNEAEQAQWHEFARDLPWLNSSHRVILRLACKLTVALDEDDVGVNKMQTLSAVLSKLGATPSDESKVSAPEEEEADEFFDN